MEQGGRGQESRKGKRIKVVVVGIRKMVVSRKRIMVEIIKIEEERKGGDESKGDGEYKKSSYNKKESPNPR
jgi:hypothetical protein